MLILCVRSPSMSQPSSPISPRAPESNPRSSSPAEMDPLYKAQDYWQQT